MSDYKKIDIKNWLEPDVKGTFNGTIEMWLNLHLRPKLITDIPEAIVSLFEAARGAMIYGFFYYPLLTLASEQCHRVLEATARNRCGQLKIPLERKIADGRMVRRNYIELIDDLVKAGKIQHKDKASWHAGRNMRNATSHPESQMLLTAGMTHGILQATAELINGLYKN